MCGPSITQLLAREGITHERDSWTAKDHCHRLYANGEYIGRYDAAQAVKFLEALTHEKLT
jgi:hypothetical protein